eukprot:8785285-Pyramimonas_sp.AAC.1
MTTGAPSFRGTTLRGPTRRTTHSAPPARQDATTMPALFDGRAIGGAQYSDSTTCEELSRECVAGCLERHERYSGATETDARCAGEEERIGASFLGDLRNAARRSAVRGGSCAPYGRPSGWA